MIFTDDTALKVGGVPLPGLIKSLEIKSDTLVEEQEIEGSPIKPKQALGYEDSKIIVELIVDDGPNETRWEKLGRIHTIFRRPEQERPYRYTLVNEHTAAYGISEVVFKSLSSKDESKREYLSLTLEFWTFNTMKITATKTSDSKTASSSSGSKPSGNTATKNLDPAYQSYRKHGRGSAPSEPAKPKTQATPAKDDAGTTQAANRLKSSRLSAATTEKQFRKGR